MGGRQAWAKPLVYHPRVDHPYQYALDKGEMRMAQCERWDNDYNKTFEVLMSGKAHVAGQLRMCDCDPGSGLSSLQVPNHLSWGRSQWCLLLLCQLCGQRRSPRSARPQVNAINAPPRQENRSLIMMSVASLSRSVVGLSRAVAPVPL